MKLGKTGQQAVAVALTTLMVGGLMAASITARADDPGKGGKKDGKGGQMPIVIGPSTIVKDPPKKK